MLAFFVFAALDPGLVQLVLGFVGLSGLGGLILAFFKLRPETNSMAVQSMESSNKQLEEERDYWRGVVKECRSERDEAIARADALAVENAKLRRLAQL